MFDAKQLVGALMQGGLAGSSQNRISHALGEGGLGQPGGFLEQLLAAAGGRAGGGGIGDLARSMLGGVAQTRRSGSPAAMGGLGALAGALLGGAGSSAKGALSGGAMALLGSLALNALRHRGGAAPGQAALSLSELPVGLRDPADATEEEVLQSTAMLVLKAMISAAKADGQVDEAELQRIVGKLRGSGAEAEAQEFVRNELQRPLDLDELLRAVPNLEVGAQVYAASLLAIEVDTEAERLYLQRLAQGLGLDPGVVRTLHTSLGIA
jgi:uncharacterized membrane protein YebE (DUF533 family)